MVGRKLVIGMGRILFSIFPKRRINHEKIKKILVFKTGSIGDTLMTTPFLRELRKMFPKAEIQYWTGNWSKPVLEGNEHATVTGFDSTMFYEGRLGEIFDLARKIRRERFDMSFVMDKHWGVILVPFLARIPIRVGFDRYGEGFANTVKIPYAQRQHEVQYYLDLIPAIGGKKSEDYRMDIAISKEYDDFAKQFLNKHRFIGRKIIGVAPGGAKNPGQDMPSRRWPIERYFDLVNELEKKKYKVILFGGKDDGAAIKMIMSNTTAVSPLGCSLKESAALIGYCKYLICNDAGLMHVAAGMDIPTISIFGPTDPIRKAPLGRKHRFLWKEMDCNQAELFAEYGPELRENILKVDVEDVLDKIKL